VLDLHRLRLLKEFADRGSIAAVAAALGYTPSAVSQQLASLEREAGAALLDRTARSAELTDTGRRLAGHAEHILAAVEAAEADVVLDKATGTWHIAGDPDKSLTWGQVAASAEGKTLTANVKFTATGPDAPQMLAELEQLFARKFDEA